MAKRVALVTGAGQEIGRTICMELALGGDAIVAADPESQRAKETAVMIKGKGLEASACWVHTNSRQSVEDLFLFVEERYGRLDVLVNAAHVLRATPFEEIPETEWDLLMDRNLKGAFLCSQAAFRMMKSLDGGKIVNISSYASRSGGIISPGLYLPCAHFGAAKAALESLTRSIALEGAPYGIRCNAVSPGPTAEELASEIPVEMKGAISARVPLGRLCSPKDIAVAAAFLASERAGYITAKILDVNGGLLMD
jgi:3-oxoacyl-[acyl-carrier protein] reductase